MKLQFVDELPETASGHGSGLLEVAQLKSNPGKWALIAAGKSSNGLASNIRKGKRAGYVVGEFEARYVTTDAGYDIYARYVGGDGA